MITVNIRKQGGAAVITIPADVLKLLDLDVGATLALDVTSQGFVARPVSKNEKRKRYSVKELLHGVSAAEHKKLKKQTKWFREGDQVRQEMEDVMNVSLTADLEFYIQEKVNSGLYSSTSEVIRESLRLMHTYEDLRDQHIKQLNNAIDVGMQQLQEGKKINAKAAYQRLKQKIQTGKGK